MIKFFRKIRQKLLDENRFSKYLIYAIGEIVLVVIGILIAIQVNTSNEIRKLRNIEVELLKSLREDLKTDFENLSIKIELDSTVAASNKELVGLLKSGNLSNALQATNYKGIPYNKFGVINRVMFFYSQKFAYQSILNQGVDIIKNDTLRQDIVNLYDYEYKITEDYLRIQLDMFVNSNEELWNSMETKDNVKIKIPNDTTLIKKNVQFINFVSHISEEYEEILGFYKNNRAYIEDLLLKVEKEIELKEK